MGESSGREGAENHDKLKMKMKVHCGYTHIMFTKKEDRAEKEKKKKKRVLGTFF